MTNKISNTIVKILLLTIIVGLGVKTNAQYTPDSVIVNILGRPNLHLAYGRALMQYYGSGDVNLDNVVNSIDAQEIRNGATNWQADVNADNTVNELDAQIIEEYVNGIRTHLPGDWNILLPAEKKDWIIKTHKILRDSYLCTYMPGWICSTYARQTLMENFGVLNVEEYDTVFLESEPELKNKTDVAKFNLPYYLYSDFINGVAHAFNVVFIGEDLNFIKDSSYNLSNFLFIDGATGKIYEPTVDFRMGIESSNYWIKWEGYYYNSFTNSYFGMCSPIRFRYNNYVAFIDDTSYEFRLMLSKVKPTFTKKVDFTLSYDEFKAKGLENIVTEYLPNDVFDKYDLNPTTEYTYQSTQTSYGICSDFNFDISINFKAKNRFNKEESNSYRIQVRDLVKPVFTNFPEDIELNANEITGTIDPSETGYATATDNSEIVNVNYNYVKTNETSSQIYYDNAITATDVCGNDSTRVQKVVVNKPNGINIVTGSDDKCKLKIYPNPIENNATIEFVGKGLNPKASICSISGQIIDSFTLDANKLEYSFSNYITGIYIIKIDAGDNCSDVQYITKVFSK